VLRLFSGQTPSVELQVFFFWRWCACSSTVSFEICWSAVRKWPMRPVSLC
jgi:hypothetical protein